MMSGEKRIILEPDWKFGKGFIETTSKVIDNQKIN